VVIARHRLALQISLGREKRIKAMGNLTHLNLSPLPNPPTHILSTMKSAIFTATVAVIAAVGVSSAPVNTEVSNHSHILSYTGSPYHQRAIGTDNNFISYHPNKRVDADDNFINYSNQKRDAEGVDDNFIKSVYQSQQRDTEGVDNNFVDSVYKPSLNKRVDTDDNFSKYQNQKRVDADDNFINCKNNKRDGVDDDFAKYTNNLYVISIQGSRAGPNFTACR